MGGVAKNCVCVFVCVCTFGARQGLWREWKESAEGRAGENLQKIDATVLRAEMGETLLTPFTLPTDHCGLPLTLVPLESVETVKTILFFLFFLL